MERSVARYADNATCLVADCQRRPVARSMCGAHYQRWNQTGDPGPAIEVVTHCQRCGEPRDTTLRGKYCTRKCKDREKASEQRARVRRSNCSVPLCEREARVESGKTVFCSMHYRRIRLYGVAGDAAPTVGGRMGVLPCAVEGCDRKYYSKGLCSLHYNRRRLTGAAGPARTLKRAAGEGSYVSESGYIYVVHQAGAGKKGRRLKKIALHRLVMERALGRPLLRTESVHHKNGDRADNRRENLELWSKSQPAGQRVTDKVAWAIELLELYAPEVLAQKPTQLRLA